jgi:hypothetical protein
MHNAGRWSRIRELNWQHRSVYTDDVVHGIVGPPMCPLRRPDAAKEFYRFLTTNTHVSDMTVTNTRCGPNLYVIERQVTATSTSRHHGL